jgi:hypothetical protein
VNGRSSCARAARRRSPPCASTPANQPPEPAAPRQLNVHQPSRRQALGQPRYYLPHHSCSCLA